mmetsp:Transcript_35201/g.59337  ORF Transcript_35201/g.59337 Transcript_35201/m.59337 type:complete len:356 (-) Transcript_35201:105-1172(-)|eukprot:CAMPEP_0198212462 /NCGR_PEP_ID=MMETSP1445-20131203/26186_1 /TAXON_ID=36898 /ORGANISM="Pyramimonas sp., Strain CCMP2087" /LENGTH=355 /DNA_ID=CAMNT_0043886913 /DNA_START=94 /DNA_END=1161 /DNA_ORIENTATION=+
MMATRTLSLGLPPVQSRTANLRPRLRSRAIITAKAASNNTSGVSSRKQGGGVQAPLVSTPPSVKTYKQKVAEKAANVADLDAKEMDVLQDKMQLGRPVQWETMFRYMDGQLSGISMEDAYAGMSKRGRGQLNLLDVRSPNDGASDIEWMNSGFFIAGTMRYGVIPGAVNVPLYSLIGGMDLYKQIRRIGFSYLFGVLNGQELRPEFVTETEKRFPDKDAPLVVFCDASRPTMDKAIGRNFGVRSRSLQACYYLMKVGGYTNVRFLEGGFMGWYNDDAMPVEEFNDPDAKPFAERNLPKMLSILSFLLFATSLKSGLFLVPLLFFAPEGSLCAAGWCELENTKNLFLHAFDHGGIL